MGSVNDQARRGIKFLLMRQLFLQIFTFSGGIVLARVLGPAQFGLFGIVSFLVGMFALLGDFGLTSSFIQRKDELTESDLQVGFTIQQILISLVVLALFVSAPTLALLYPKVSSLIMVSLVRVLAFGLFLASWRAISALQLERQLRYRELAWIEIFESVSYQGTSIVLVLMGYGIWSLIVAVLVRGVLGATLVYISAPWRIRLRFDPRIAKEILRYGIPFQLQLIANQVDSWISPILVASLIGPRAVGLLTFAGSNGRKPLLIVDSVTRVAFSHFARIQHDRPEVERVVTRYLTYLLLITGLWFAVLLTSGPSLVGWIYSKQWEPAVPALILFAGGVSFDAMSVLLSVTLSSIGLVNLSTRAELVRSLSNVAFSFPLVLLMGFTGVVIAYLAALIVGVAIKFRGFGEGSFKRLLTPIAAIIVAPMLVSIIVGELAAIVPLLIGLRAILVTCVVCAVYLSMIWLTGPKWLVESMQKGLVTYLPFQLTRSVKAMD